MLTWIVLFSLFVPLAPTHATDSEAGVPSSDGTGLAPEPIRYRGIERLLAKFEAEAAAESDQNR